MSESINYIVITNKSNCYRWLSGLSDSLNNFIFVEPDERERIYNLLDSVDAGVVLVHLKSQTANGELISDEEISPDISAVLTYLKYQEQSSSISSTNKVTQELNADIALVEEMLQHKPMLKIIGLADVINQTLLLPIMRAGVCDLIQIGTPAHETSAIIARYNKRLPTIENAEKSELGKLTPILNARAEDGAPLLAIHLALGMQRDGSTLLIDFGVPHADIMLMMGVSAKFNFIDVINNRTRLDNTLIKTGFAKHSSGLTLIAMPEKDGEEVVFNPNEIYLVLHALKKHFKYIVINLGGLNDLELIKVVLSATDTTLFLVKQTVPNCKRNYDLLENLRQKKINIPDPRMIVDRYLPNARPNAGSVSQSMSIPLLCTLPSAGILRLQTMNTAESMFEHHSNCDYVKGVVQILQRLYGINMQKRENGFSNLTSKLYAKLVR